MPFAAFSPTFTLLPSKLTVPALIFASLSAFILAVLHSIFISLSAVIFIFLALISLSSVIVIVIDLSITISALPLISAFKILSFLSYSIAVSSSNVILYLFSTVIKG